MNVYVEYVVIDNFIIDFLLLLLTFKKRGEKIKKGRIVVSALFGTVVTLFFPFLTFHELIVFFLKIILCCAMVAIPCKKMGFSTYLKKVFKFLILTFAFGGAITGVTSLLGIEYAFLYGSTNSPIPYSIVIVLGLSIYFIVLKIYSKLFEKQIVYPFVCVCGLFCNGDKTQAKGFLDSGNHLVYNGQGVCIASDKLVQELFLSGVIKGAPKGLVGLKTVAGEDVIKIYEIERLEIYFNKKKNIFYKAQIGVSDKKLFTHEDYDLLLPAEYLINES